MFCRSLGLLLVLVAAVCSAPAPAWSADQELADFEQELRTRLDSHRYLKHSKYEWVRDHEPYLFVVQLPPGRDATWAQEVAARRAEWLLTMHARFAEDCAQPAGLRLQSARPRLAVIVLPNEEEFGFYLSVERVKKGEGRPAYYNAEEGYLVVREIPFHRPTPEDLPLHHAELREAAYQLVHAYSASAAEPDPLWLREGLADNLAAHRRMEAAALDERELSDTSLRTLVRVIKNRPARAVYLLPLYLFLRQASYEALDATCSQLRSGAAAFRYEPELGAEVYRATAGALYHYLARVAPAETQKQLKAYVEEALKGRFSPSSFARNFKGLSVPQLERELWQDVWNEHRKRWPDERLDPAMLSAFLAERGGPGLEVEEVAPEVTPAGLLEALADPDAHVALAIARVRAGDAEGAVALLDDCLAKGVPEEAARRVLLEKERVQAWIQLRDAFLAHLVALDRKFAFEHRGERVLAKVEAYQDGTLRFGENKQDVETLAVSDIEALELATRMGESKWGFEGGWALAYPFVITYDKKVKRYLRGDAPELARLAEDADADYPDRREGIELAAALLALVDLGQPATAAEAERSLALIREVWGAREKAPFVAELRETLRGLAEQSLAKRLAEAGPGLALSGAVKQLEGGRIRVLYDFEKADQLADWLPTDDRARPRGTFGELKRAEPLAECNGGVLETAGEVSLRHVLEFEGVQTLQWKNKMVAGEDASTDQQLNFHVSLCHSGKTGSITVINSIALEIADFAVRANRRQDPETVEVRYDEQYSCALEHDGAKRVRFLRGGNEIFADDCGGCQSGGVQLWVHSDYLVEFDDVEITGKATEKSLAELEERWIDAEVEELGLAEE